MDELIKTTVNEQGEILVSGRELHEFLEVKTAYKDWFPRMVEYGFAEGSDYVEIVEKVEAQKRARTYDQINHALKIDMAKEISMIQRNEKGKQARQYFIEIEKAFKARFEQDPITLALEAALETRKQVQVIEKDVTEVKGTLKILENNLVLTSSQAKAINKKVAERVYLALGERGTPAFEKLKNKVFKACWRDFKDLFDISEYRELPRLKFELGMQFLADWEPNATLKFEIKQLNSQGNLFV